MNYESNRKFGDKFMHEVSGILGQALIMPAPQIEDSERNTDLIVLGMNNVRIGCRIRQNRYLGNYGHEFTVRARSQNGGKTEITKIIEGWGDYLFYGFASECEKHLDRWTIISLNEFRIWHSRQQAKTKSIPGDFKPNKDGTALYGFDLRDMPKEMIFKKNWEFDSQAA